MTRLDLYGSILKVISRKIGAIMRNKILSFLYEQVNQGKIPQIRKGMLEDFEEFIANLLAEEEVKRSTANILAKQQKLQKEGDE